jgi:hypothetical protein
MSYAAGLNAVPQHAWLNSKHTLRANCSPGGLRNIRAERSILK